MFDDDLDVDADEGLEELVDESLPVEGFVAVLTGLAEVESDE